MMLGDRRPSSLLNQNVLCDDTLREIVTPEVWTAFQTTRKTGSPMPKTLKNMLASSIREWAQSKGCETYALFFSPVRGPLHGEKIETFLGIDFAAGGKLVSELSGTELFQTETDGSSFPNGGLRETHRAAAYVAWDTSSSPFIYRHTLYIPAAFISWRGDALDNKMPLLRSNAAVEKQVLRLLRHLGDGTTKQVITNVGWEQEFFIVDRDTWAQRPDLMYTNRTLLGRAPLKGQTQSTNYFGKMPLKVRRFMQTIRQEFWRTGISIKALHNEVAPSQHEVCPIFSVTSSAADTNVVAMEIMRDIAYEMGLQVLFHEKPFRGINGSGKHLNWGLNTDTGLNLFVLGKTDEDRRRFVTFTAALTQAVYKHGDLLRIGIATAGNDHRLGAHEAPPAVITLGLGQVLEEQMRAISRGKPLHDVHADADRLLPAVGSVPPVQTTVEDRNRTAPIPWCGNRFEFRACGSNQHIAWPLAMLHAAMADSCRRMADAVDQGKDLDTVVRETIAENQGAMFSGNGYDAENLQRLVEKEKLFNLRTSPDAYDRLSDAKNVEVLSSLGILAEHEVLARQAILQEAFANDIIIEANTLLSMLRTGVAPAAANAAKEDALLGSLAEKSEGLYKPRRDAHKELLEQIDALDKAIRKFPSSGDPREQAHYANDVLKPIFIAARAPSDKLEQLIDSKLWPFPSLDRVLFRV